MSNVNVVIFAKDRIAQLDLLLRSMRRVGIKEGNILLKTDDYAKWLPLSYKFKEFTFIPQTREFYVDLAELIDDRPVWLLCDDDVVVARPSLPMAVAALNDFDITHFSTRLGMSQSYCYPLDRHHGSLNELKVVTNYMPSSIFGEVFGVWDWRDSRIPESDFKYYAAVNGAIWRGNELTRLVKSSQANNPNQLEDYILAQPQSTKQLACFHSQRTVNVPLNIVQSTHTTNRQEGISVEELNAKYADGLQIDLDDILKRVDGTSAFLTITKPLLWEKQD